MATDPAVCIECGARVPSGRFSCPECGALRASVRGRADAAPAAATALLQPTSGFDHPGPASTPGPLTTSTEENRPDAAATGLRPIAGGYVAAAPVAYAPVAFPPAAVSSVSTRPDTTPPSSLSVSASVAAATVDPPSRPLEPSTPMALILAGQPFETPYDTSGWLGRGGSLAATLSFVLPWGASSVAVVGTGAIGHGYFDRWALVNAWYLLPMLLALSVFVISVVPNRLLLWIRSGVLPLVTGALCLGIAFVYVGGPFGGGPGVAILAVASVVMAAGGLIAVRPGRHVEPPSIV